MNLTIYLPDELAQWARETDLNVSGFVREALERERSRREANAANSKVHELHVKGTGGSYTVRLHGTEIVEDWGYGVLFLTDDGEIICWDPTGRLDRRLKVEDLHDWLIEDDKAYVKAMTALGKEAVVDIGQAKK